MKILIKNHKFRYTLGAEGISVFGDFLFVIALLTYASNLLESKLGLSMHNFLLTLPMVIGFVFGMLADKTKKLIKALLFTNFINLIIFIIIGLIFTFESQIATLIQTNLIVKDPKLSIFIAVLILLIIVQLISAYESGVSTCLFVKIVAQEDVAEARGLISGTLHSVKILAKFLAAILLSVITYADIAYINAVTFGVVILIYGLFYIKNKEFIIKLDQESETQIQTQEKKEKGLSLYAKLKLIVKEILANKLLSILMKIGILINTVVFSIEPVYLIAISSYSEYQIINFQTTLSIALIVSSVGMIIGNMFILPFFKGDKVSFYVFLATLFIIGLFFIILLISYNFQFSSFSTTVLNDVPALINNANLLSVIYFAIDFMLMICLSIQRAKSGCNNFKRIKSEHFSN